MATEYKLSFTATEIDERLGKIDSLADRSELPSKLSELTNDSGFATEGYVDVAIANIDIPEVDLSSYALKSEIPTDYLKSVPEEYITETELATKGYLTSYTETDPTVPAWAKEATKPSYTASEVGALPSDTVIPTVPDNVSAFTNDAGYLTEHQSLDGLATEEYVKTQIEAIPTPNVSSHINTHNTATNAHNDIRLLVEGLTTRLNTLADSDDTTLDQMSEVVAYIKNNKSLIEGITNNKVNVSDIIDNLTTNVSNKPLSAAQGVALKALIDAIVVPTKVSELTNDKGYLTEHQSLDAYAKTVDLGALAKKDSLTATDVGARPNTWMPSASDVGALPNTTAIPDALSDLTADSTHRLVTDSEKATWNAKAEVSAIPTKVSQLTNDSKFLTSFTETDPTVPSWAKAASKPSYTKSEVGLGNVDNVKQYSAENPPVIVKSKPPTDTSVLWVDLDDDTVDEFSGGYVVQNEAPSDTSVLWVDPSDNSDNKFQEAVNIALAQAKASGEFDGKAPEKGVDYFTSADKAEMVNAVIAALPVYAGEVL